MYNEISKSNINRFLSLVVIVIAIFLVMIFTNNIIYPFNKMLADIINIVFFVFSVYFYMRFIVTQYEYKIENGKLIFTKILNKNNPQALLVADIRNIESIVKYNDLVQNNSQVLNFCTKFDKSKRYAFFINVENKSYTVLFEPSDALLEMINEVKS